MKNILKTSLYLFVFAIAGIIFQISCSNSENATLSTPTQNKLIFTESSGGVTTISISDYDGTNVIQVPITLPPNVVFNFVNGNASAKLSPDGLKVFFIAVDNNSNSQALYSCDIDGSNVQQVRLVNNTSYFHYDLN